MSGRNRHRTPPAYDVVRRRIVRMVRSLIRVESEYDVLYDSGYIFAHDVPGYWAGREASAAVVNGGATFVRWRLIRAAEAIDDAFDAVQVARAALDNVETKIDVKATSGNELLGVCNVYPDFPHAVGAHEGKREKRLCVNWRNPASTAEVRQAQRQQAKRLGRAVPGGSAAVNDEVTG